MFQAVARCLIVVAITRRVIGASTSNFVDLGKWKKTQKEIGEGKLNKGMCKSDEPFWDL